MEKNINNLVANNIAKKENNVNKKLGVLLPLSFSLFLVFIIAFISVTYSWIFSTYFSNIQGVNIAVGDSQGLVMLINGELTDTIDINSYLGSSFEDFSLKEVSSANGRDLYLRDMNTYYDDTLGIYDSIDVAEDNIGIIQFRSANVNDNNNNFIYFNFTLQASGSNRYLIFDSAQSYINNISSVSDNPIRASLTFDDGSTVVTKIVGNRQEYLGNYYTKAVGSVDSTTKVGFTTNQNVSSFQGYDGYDGTVFDASETLFFLQQDVEVSVTVRIWLEGGDPDCVDAIASSALDIALRFDNIDESEVT